MLPTYQRIGGSQPANPLLAVRRSFRASEKCLILLVLLTFGFVCFGGFFFLPDNFGADRVLKVYKQFQRAGPEIFIPPPPPAHGLLEGDEDPHKMNDREKLQEKIRKELPDDFLEKPDLDADRTAGPEFDNALDSRPPAVAGPGGGGIPGVVAPPGILEEPELKGSSSRSRSSPGGFHTFNSTVGEDPDPAVREKRNKVKEGFNPERLGRLIKVCTKGTGASRELVEGYKRLEFPADPVTQCVMRCIGLNMGVYDDLTGVHMDATWQMFRSGRADSDKQAYVDEHLGCIRGKLAPLGEDAYCERVYGSYLCYKEEFERLTMGAAKGSKN